jgi:predicted nucleic acid-binding protein
MAIFLDTGFFTGLYHPNDSHFEKSTEIFQHMSKGEFGLIYTSPHVIAESATLLLVRTRSNLSLLRDFFEDLYGTSKYVSILPWTAELESKTWELFFKVNKKHQEKKQARSFTDISNLVYCQEYQITHIVSYDEQFKGYLQVVD